MDRNLNLKSRAKSIRLAWNGIILVFNNEPNAKIHLAATVAVIAAGLVRHLDTHRWLMLTIAIALVWITETLNSAIEKLADFACQRQIHPEIKVIKDISAGAVLLASIASIVIGLLVFLG